MGRDGRSVNTELPVFLTDRQLATLLFLQHRPLRQTDTTDITLPSHQTIRLPEKEKKNGYRNSLLSSQECRQESHAILYTVTLNHAQHTRRSSNGQQESREIIDWSAHTNFQSRRAKISLPEQRTNFSSGCYWLLQQRPYRVYSKVSGAG